MDNHFLVGMVAGLALVCFCWLVRYLYRGVHILIYLHQRRGFVRKKSGGSHQSAQS